ncbi:MAG TPA: hypothetical protein VFA75_09970 [Nevskia sp.]|nr:hypothetical protein [Nevskia sp.]
MDLAEGQYFDPQWPPEILQAAQQLDARGVGIKRIARFFVTSRHTVYGWLRRQG